MTSIALGVLLVSHTAHADPALASAKDNDGQVLMAAGHVAQACEAFEASFRADPSAGVLIHLAYCREMNRQLASSWRAYKAALGRAQDPDKRKVATKGAAALEAQLSYLTVSVSDDSRVAGLTVTCNGKPLDPSSWNRALPVDGGDFVIVGHASGYDDWQTVAHVAVDRAKVSVDVPRLKKLPSLGQVATLPPGSQTGATATVDHPTTPSITTDAGRPSRAKLVIALAIAGVVGVGAGVGLELESRSLQNQSDQICPPGMMCYSQHAVDLNGAARRDAVLAIIGFAAGGAAIAGASVLWLTAPAPRQTMAFRPVLGADRVGVSFTRSF